MMLDRLLHALPGYVEVGVVNLIANAVSSRCRCRNAGGPRPEKGVENRVPGEREQSYKPFRKGLGKGAGCPRSLDSPLMSVQADRSHVRISSFVSMERAF